MTETELVSLGRRRGRKRWLVDHRGHSLAVFVVGERIVVLDALCPHRGGPLVEGVVRDGGVVCPWHWYMFDLDTGQCRTADQEPVGRYDVRTEGGQLFAVVPARAPAPSLVERLRAHARAAPKPKPGSPPQPASPPKP